MILYFSIRLLGLHISKRSVNKRHSTSIYKGQKQDSQYMYMYICVICAPHNPYVWLCTLGIQDNPLYDRVYRNNKKLFIFCKPQRICKIFNSCFQLGIH